MRNKITMNTTVIEYNDITVVNTYTKAVDEVGLWHSEKIIFEKYLAPSMNILDLGCGAGRTTFNLFYMGYTEITGFDLADGMILECNKRAKNENLQIKFIYGDARDMTFNDSSFDACIFSFNGLMTIPMRQNRFKVFSEVSRILKPGGIFIFTTHNMNDEKHLTYWEQEKKCWEEGKQNRRFHEFGDMAAIEKKSAGQIEAFVHVPEYTEIFEETSKSGFTIIEKAIRSNLCQENELTIESSDECMFWVCRKLF